MGTAKPQFSITNESWTFDREPGEQWWFIAENSPKKWESIQQNPIIQWVKYPSEVPGKMSHATHSVSDAIASYSSHSAS